MNIRHERATAVALTMLALALASCALAEDSDIEITPFGGAGVQFEYEGTRLAEAAAAPFAGAVWHDLGVRLLSKQPLSLCETTTFSRAD